MSPKTTRLLSDFVIIMSHQECELTVHYSNNDVTRWHQQALTIKRHHNDLMAIVQVLLQQCHIMNSPWSNTPFIRTKRYLDRDLDSYLDREILSRVNTSSSR